MKLEERGSYWMLEGPGFLEGGQEGIVIKLSPEPGSGSDRVLQGSAFR